MGDDSRKPRGFGNRGSDTAAVEWDKGRIKDDTIHDTIKACIEHFDVLLANRDTSSASAHSNNARRYDVDLIRESKEKFDAWRHYTGALPSGARWTLDTRLEGEETVRSMTKEMLQMLVLNLEHVSEDDDTTQQEAARSIKWVIRQLESLGRLMPKASVAIQKFGLHAQFGPGDKSSIEHHVSRVIKRTFPDAPSSLCQLLARSVEVRRLRLFHNVNSKAETGFDELPRNVYDPPSPEFEEDFEEDGEGYTSFRMPQTALLNKIFHDGMNGNWVLPNPQNRFSQSELMNPKIRTGITHSSQSSPANDLETYGPSHGRQRESSNAYEFPFGPAADVEADSASLKTHIQRTSQAAPSGETSYSGRIDSLFTRDYPLKPAFALEDPTCTCPYCSKALRTAQLGNRESYWFNHFDKDVLPYVCIADECRSPVNFFARVDSWIEHMETLHSKRWNTIVHTTIWRCSTEHQELQFNDVETFKAHMTNPQNHPDRKPPTPVQTEALCCTRRTFKIRNEELTCPICESIPAEVNAAQPEHASIPAKDLLYAHIANEIRTVALMFLQSPRSSEVPQTMTVTPHSLRDEKDNDNNSITNNANYTPTSFDSGVATSQVQMANSVSLAGLGLTLNSDKMKGKPAGTSSIAGIDMTIGHEKAPAQREAATEGVSGSSGASVQKSRVFTWLDECEIEILHDCRDALIDICFVHGTTDSQGMTWNTEGHTIPWAQTDLPFFTKRARVLAYNYSPNFDCGLGDWYLGLNRHADACLTKLMQARASAEDSLRPLVFVGHSFGGMICKAVVLRSSEQHDGIGRNIYTNTGGVIFVGTPHGDSWQTAWTTLRALNSETLPEFADEYLDKDSGCMKSIKKLQTRFVDFIETQHILGKDVRILCFYEQLPSSDFGVVVSKTSATFEDCKPLGISASHANMLKFDSEQDDGFQRILGTLHTWETAVSGTRYESNNKSDKESDISIAESIEEAMRFARNLGSRIMHKRLHLRLPGRISPRFDGLEADDGSDTSVMHDYPTSFDWDRTSQDVIALCTTHRTVQVL